MKLIQTILLTALISALLSGCSVFKFPSVYTINVQQGNIVNQEMIDQLKPGMTKRQVRYIMGTAMVTDTFDQDRWDYFYSIKSGKTAKVLRRQLTVYFVDDKLSYFEGDLKPGDTDNKNINIDADDPENIDAEDS